MMNDNSGLKFLKSVTFNMCMVEKDQTLKAWKKSNFIIKNDVKSQEQAFHSSLLNHHLK